MDQCTIQVRGEDGRRLAAAGTLIVDNHGAVGMEGMEQGSKGELLFDADLEPEGLVVTPKEPGYWVTYSQTCDDGDVIVCPSIDNSTNASWWHVLLGAHINDPDRGSGVRIGVIDTGFARQPGLDHVQVIAGRGKVSRPRTAGAFWSHGEAVCRIIGDSAAKGRCAAIAPGAQIYFASGDFTAQTVRHRWFQWPGLDEENGGLDPAEVANSIFAMTFDCEVDLINLSLGTWERREEESALAEAISLARSRGISIVCAAGNLPEDTAAFPACLRDCIGVGAYGVADEEPECGLGPFLASMRDEQGEIQGQDIFFSPLSAYGNGIDTIAPGVGVLIARNGVPAFDVTGTSFAAPIVTGLLAVDLASDAAYLELPRTEVRARYVEKRLRELCIRSGIDEDWEGYGIIVLRGTES